MTAQTLREKLLDVSDAIGYIQKGGTNTAQNYKYVGEAQVVEKVRPEFIKRGILAYPQHRLIGAPVQFTTAKGSVQFLSTVETKWVFTDGTDTIEVIVLGQGADAGDKGVFKAQTGSKKYGLLQALMIATGDDPEETRTDEAEEQPKKPAARSTKKVPVEDDPAHRSADGDPNGYGDPAKPITDAQKRLIRAKAREHNVTNEQLGELRLKVTGKHSSAQMTNGDVDALVSVLGDVARMAELLTGGELVE